MKKRLYTSVSLLLLILTINLNGQEWIPSGDFDLPNGWGVSSISIVDEDTVWAAAINWLSNSVTPMVYRTINGGVDWEGHPVPGGFGKQLYSIVGLDAVTALVTTNDNLPWNGPGGSKILYKTIDGGMNWQPVLQHNAAGYILHFFNGLDGVCINQDDVAITDSGGDSWTLVDGDSIPDLAIGEIAGGFIQNIPSSLATIGDTLWMGTNKGRIFRSCNRGQKWEVFNLNLGDNPAIYAVAFSDAKNGLAGYREASLGSLKLARTKDGGENWEPHYVPDGIELKEFIHIPGTPSTFIGSSYVNPPQTAFLSDYDEEWVIVDNALSINALEFSTLQLGWSADGTTMPSNNPEVYKWDYVNYIDDVMKLKNILVYPIPFENELTVRSDDQVIQRVKVYDMNGRIFFSQVGDGNQELHLDLPSLPSGIYFIDLKTNIGRIVKKLVRK